MGTATFSMFLMLTLYMRHVLGYSPMKTGVAYRFSFVPISIAALACVESAEAGLASGLINTSQQIGGALGIAALSTIATSRTEDSLVSGAILPQALVDGFSSAFTVGAIFALIGVTTRVLVQSPNQNPRPPYQSDMWLVPAAPPRPLR